MTEIEPGVFTAKQVMPCLPKDIRVIRYGVPRVFNRNEFQLEEAAARVLSFSSRDQWVGVSLARLVNEMQKEIDLRNDVMEIRAHNALLTRTYKFQLREYQRKCRLTFGIYSLFAFKPWPPQLIVEPEYRVMMSVLFTGGPDHIVDGIRELVAQDYLEREFVVNMEDAVFFPTAKLVQKIMQKQGVQAA